MTPPPDELDLTAATTGDWVPGYELRAVVGTGGFGTVYEGRQIKLDRVVAVKIIHRDRMTIPALAARFEAEAMTLGRLHHPNVVQVYDYGQHGGSFFIAMELLEGEDLGGRLRRAGPVDERTAWAIARQAAAGLAHAAAHGVVHRDVKPANLFLVPTSAGLGLPRDIPLVKVMDFGLARTRAEGDGPDAHLTAPGAVLGTPVYMAPEQYRRAAEVDHRADIYGLGATVFHALDGRPPFAGPTLWEIMAQKLEHTPRLGAGVSRESAELVRAMMAADPKDRIGTYEELIDRIDQLPVVQRPDSFLAARGRPARSRRRRWVWAGAAGAALTVAAAGLVLGRGFPAGWRPGAGSETGPPARYEPTGDREDLFDGESVSLWSPSPGGTVEIETDGEGSRALSITGFARRRFTAVEDYRVTLGLYLHTAAAAEVHFAIPEAGPRQVLRIAKVGGVVLGAREGHRGPFQPRENGPALLFPSANWFGGRVRYAEVVVERTGGRWAVFFNRDEVGRVEDDRPVAPEFWVRAEDGAVWVADGWLTPLGRK